MRTITVERGEIPHDWTPEHEGVLTQGHRKGIVSAAPTKVAGAVLALGVRLLRRGNHLWRVHLRHGGLRRQGGVARALHDPRGRGRP